MTPETITPNVDPATGKATDTPTGAPSSTARTRARDTPPKRKPPKPSPQKIATQAIEDGIAQILTFPAIPCIAMGDQWAAEHFATQGRNFAKQLAEMSERHPAIRKWCERLLEGESVAVLGMSATMYAIPPMIHWGILPAPDALRSALGVPPVPSVAPDDGTGSEGASQTRNDRNGSNGYGPHYPGHDGATN